MPRASTGPTAQPSLAARSAAFDRVMPEVYPPRAPRSSAQAREGPLRRGAHRVVGAPEVGADGGRVPAIAGPAGEEEGVPDQAVEARAGEGGPVEPRPVL